MFIKRIIGMMVGIVLICTMPTVAMAQDFRVNHQQLAGYDHCSSIYTQRTSNVEGYRAITHSMPSMSQLSTCSTVLGTCKDESQSGSTQNSGTSHGPRRVSEDDHNADPFMPLGDTPWWFMCACACMCAFIIYKRTRKQN